MSLAAMNVPGQPITDGVGRIAGFVNAYTYQQGDEICLIDTGFSRKAKQIVRAFEAANVPLNLVRKAVLTHHHVDHMGGAAYFVKNVRTPLACHTYDVPYVDGREKARMPLLMRLFVRIHPAPVAIPLKDGDRVGRLLVIHVPGHTPGEIALYDAERKILFAGDSIAERKGDLLLPGPRFAFNLTQAIQSLASLRALDIELLLPGHGEPVREDVGTLLDNLMRRAPGDYLRGRGGSQRGHPPTNRNA
jgi:glyoxylase-like metal-dependent hydrolase (beta-lactamase superfamily II)